MKSRDTFAPIGPYLVTKDEIADPQKLPIKLWVNGELKQDFNTDDMAHNIARCIEWASSIHTLEPGDILATGTNHRGLSSFMDGDVVELETEGLGRLRFNIRDELKRTWLRETRLDRQQRGSRDRRHSYRVNTRKPTDEVRFIPLCTRPWPIEPVAWHQGGSRAEDLAAASELHSCSSGSTIRWSLPP